MTVTITQNLAIIQLTHKKNTRWNEKTLDLVEKHKEWHHWLQHSVAAMLLFLKQPRYIIWVSVTNMFCGSIRLRQGFPTWGMLILGWLVLASTTAQVTMRTYLEHRQGAWGHSYAQTGTTRHTYIYTRVHALVPCTNIINRVHVSPGVHLPIRRGTLKIINRRAKYICI